MMKTTKERLIAASTLLGSLMFLAALVFVSLFTLQGLDFVNTEITPRISALALYLFYLDLFVFTPLAFFNKTRRFAGLGFYISAWLFLFTLWVFCFLLSYSIWGPFAAYLGIFLAGIGVFPIAILAILIHRLWIIFGLISIGIVIIIFLRWLGKYLVETSMGRRMFEDKHHSQNQSRSKQA